MSSEYRNEKADLISFLRRNIDEDDIPIPFDLGDPDEPYSDADLAFPNYDGGLNFPGIYPSSKDTSIFGGGETQYSGMRPDTGGPFQDTTVSMQVDCWGGTLETSRVVDEGIHPIRLANDMAKVVHHACINNAVNIDNYRWISSTVPTEAHNAESNKTEYREYVIVRLGYTKEGYNALVES